MSQLVAKREELASKQKALAAIFSEAKTSDPNVYDLKLVKSLDGSDADRRGVIQQLNSELNDLAKDVELLTAQENVTAMGKHLNAPVSGLTMPSGAPQAKSIGELFVASDAYKSGIKAKQGVEGSFDIDAKAFVQSYGLKTTMTEAAGYAPQAIRVADIVPFATRPIQLLDMIPALDTSQNAVVFMEETTFTNNAVETPENTAYPENALAFTERTSSVRKIPAFLPVTDEQMEDVPFIQSYVTDRLGFMVRQRLDGQLIVGDGNAPNLRGIKNASNLNTQAKGSDPAPDAIYKGIVTVFLVGRAVANLVVMHPTDWQNLRLLRTAEGVYIWGSPSDAGQPRIWGLPVAQSDADTAGTAYLGDFANYSYLAYRHGLDIQVGYINDDFKLGKKSIRADVRVAFVIRRGAAFAKVTGL
jgi:HK97 family phage major capsid protein